jgi:hypothetical protein
VTVSPKQAAVLLGGQVDGNGWINAPGPGHSKRDRSLSVKLDPKAPEGFAVYSHAADDWKECRDYVRGKLGLEEWKPTSRDSRDAKQPVYTVASYTYEDADGCDHWRVDHRSDGSFQHYHWDVDGWSKGQPKIAFPYRLNEIRPDEPVWVVYGERNAELLADGFGVNATTFPSGTDAHEDWNNLHHLDGDVRVLNVGGFKGSKFAAEAAKAFNTVVWRLPEGFATLNDYACEDTATVSAFTCDDYAHESEIVPDTIHEPEPIRRYIPTPYTWTEPSTIAPREWLYGSHLIRRYVSTTISPGGLGKSSMVMVEALSMVSGKALLGERVHPAEPLRVWYWNGEDPNDEGARRIQAAAIEHKLTPDDIGDRLFMDSGRDMRITLAKMTRGEIELDETLFEEIEAALIERQIDVWSLDPFVSTHQVSENDNGAIDAIIKRLGIVAEKANVAIELVHHVRKPSGGDTARTDVNDARGASALIGGVRSARVLNAMSAQESEDYGIENRFSYFRVDNGKSNLAPRSNETKWRRIVSVDLENGPTLEESDHIGVVIPWTPPANTSAISDADVMVAQRIAYEHPELARADTKSGDWLGHALGRALGIDSVDPKGKRDLERALRDWHKSGALVQEIRPDANRKPRQYFACPESERPLSVVVAADVIEDDPNLF